MRHTKKTTVKILTEELYFSRDEDSELVFMGRKMPSKIDADGKAVFVAAEDDRLEYVKNTVVPIPAGCYAHVTGKLNIVMYDKNGCILNFNEIEERIKRPY